MGMLQQTINRDRPYGRVFQGEGKVASGEKDAYYYQHGLYFNHQGKLIHDDINKSRMELISAMGANDAESVPQVQAANREPANPDVVAVLEKKTDDEVFDMAGKLADTLKKRGVVNTYKPSPEQRDENIGFIAKYAG